MRMIRQRLGAFVLVTHALLLWGVARAASAPEPWPATTSSKDIDVPGPGKVPQLIFTCCDQGIRAMHSLFADPMVLADLKELHAGLAVALGDLSPERTLLVHRLNEAGIPAIAWLLLPGEQGYYANVDNAPQMAARFAMFDKWTREHGLRWEAVGLDIEPNFGEFKAPKWRIFWTMLRRSFDGERVRGPRAAYSALIREIRARGYRVQTYQLPFLADERKVHSTMLERLFGLVDVRGDEEVLMAYSSFNHMAGGAVVWTYSQDAQRLAVGSTLGSGNAKLDAKYGPLNWEEFSRDTIVASHFSPAVGVYSLEGCVRQGFLTRLTGKDWSQGVVLPAAAMARMHRFRLTVQSILWTASHLLYLVAALLMAVIWIIRRRIRRKQSAVTTVGKS